MSKFKPFIKWVGGKRLTADFIITEINKEEYNTYFEPFLGGGAVFLKLKPKKAYLSDINEELINSYQMVKNNLNKLMKEIDNNFRIPHIEKGEDFYYQVRKMDRTESFPNLSNIIRAARFIYLNKTCFNGIYRVNKKGQFNVPFGHYKNPKIYDKQNLNLLKEYFNDDSIIFNSHSYLDIEDLVSADDVVYFDPPYDIEKKNSEFVSYDKRGFNRQNQRELKQLCDLLIEKGTRVFISNSKTDFIMDLYGNNKYDIYTIKDKQVYRSVSANSGSRRKYGEVLIVGKKNN